MTRAYYAAVHLVKQIQALVACCCPVRLDALWQARCLLYSRPVLKPANVHCSQQAIIITPCSGTSDVTHDSMLHNGLLSVAVVTLGCCCCSYDCLLVPETAKPVPAACLQQPQ